MPSELAQKAIDWIRGDDAVLYKPVPPSMHHIHVTTLLHQHPFHPYDPVITSPDQPCYEENQRMFRCMSQRPDEEPLHLKHVNCYDPFKVALMKCRAALKRQMRQQAEAGGTTTGD